MFSALKGLSRSARGAIKNFFSVFALRILQKLFALASIFFLVRVLTPEQFGEYQFILTVMVIVSVTALSSGNNTVMQSVARGFGGTYRHIQLWGLVGSLLGSLILLAMGAFFYWQQGKLTLGIGLAASAIFFPLAKGLVLWKSEIVGREKFASLLIWDGLAALVVQAGIVAAVLVLPANYVYPLLAFLILSAGLNIVFTAITLQRSRGGKTSAQAAAVAKVEDGSLRYTVETTIYTLPHLIANHIEKILLFAFFSADAMALFAIAAKLPELARSFLQDMAAILAPKLARLTSYSHDLERVFRWIAWSFGAACIAFAVLIIPLVFELLFGTPYLAAMPYSVAMMVVVGIGNVAVLRFRFIRSQLDAGSMRDVTLRTSAVRILASIVLVPLFGMWGAVGSQLVVKLFQVYAVGRLIGKEYRQEHSEPKA